MKRSLPIPPIAKIPFSPAIAQRDDDKANIDVEVRRKRQDGGWLYSVNAEGFALAEPQAVWNVLTEYDRLHEFVPHLQWSKQLSRSGREAVIRQKARTEFLIFRKSICLEMRVTEQPISVIDMISCRAI